MTRADELKRKYKLKKHPEGGWYTEVYTSPRGAEGRPFMGSIYFLLEGEELSHFHRIDCDEIWYHHEGCPLAVTAIVDGAVRRIVVGSGEGLTPTAVIPAGAVFASELLDKSGYCFVSCATTPQFRDEGMHLADRAEIRALCPSEYERLEHLILPRA